MRLEPRVPAIWRDRMAVGTSTGSSSRISSPKPGSTRSHTASVASGVTSRGLGPVPPVVRMSEQPSTSASSMSAASIFGRSSGTSRRTGRHGERADLRAPPRSRAALVLVDALRGPVRNGDDADRKIRQGVPRYFHGELSGRSALMPYDDVSVTDARRRSERSQAHSGTVLPPFSDAGYQRGWRCAKAAAGSMKCASIFIPPSVNMKYVSAMHAKHVTVTKS